ncbi:MAG: LacI family transcriptional regulator [Eubacteriales bacterium]|nr:LacI family transcriptional regulator [Eubacteriales bacterium]
MEIERKTIYDIAEHAGVSIATVSRVMRGETGVSAKTRRKVEEVITRYNYQPSAYARGLTQKHTKTYGIILPKLANPNYVMLFEGAYDEAAANGYAMSLFPWENMNDAGLDVVEVLSERRLDGVIICLEFIGADELETWRNKLTAIRQYMPVVLTGTMPPGLDFPSVTVDLSECVHKSVEYLAKLGHERIALLGGFDEQLMPYSRDASYRKALEEAHLPMVDQYRVFGRCTVEDGKRQLDEMLSHLVPSQWPTAIIAANDMVAFGVLHAAEGRGLRMPEDLSVIGCDDVFYTEYSNPPLTSMRTRQTEIGCRAVQMLLDESVRGQETLPCELIVRRSCAQVKG